MIPFIDLQTQKSRIADDVQRRMAAVVAHGKFIMGPEIEALEARLSDFAEVTHCISCSSGTDALLMALMALGVGPGDAVFTTPFTFIATAEVISLLGATPVFVDIDERSYNLDPTHLETAIEAVMQKDASLYPLPLPALQGSGLRPKAIIPVDLYGQPAEYALINEIAKKHQMTVIGDAAQSFGATYRGRRATATPDIACTSFFPAKPLGCFGDGGAIFTDDKKLAELCVSLRVHGKGSHKYDNARQGLNARLDTLQAAVLLSKMTIFPDELRQRHEIATQYKESLAQIEGVTPPEMPEETTSAWAQYTLRSPNREKIQKALTEQGIPSVIYYPCPLHQQQAYKYLDYATGDMPITEKAAKEVFSIPMHPYLSEETISTIVDVIANA